MKSVFEFHNIGKSFNRNPVLHSVSFSLRSGSVMGLVGENGAGKSTLMNIMGGVHQPEEGKMTFDGEPYRPNHPSDADEAGIAFIHQDLNLFTNLSIAENFFITRFPKCSFPFPWIDTSSMHHLAEEWLRQIELLIPAATKIEQLSPAERQLVEIAKSIGMNTRIILFDEPTTSLTSFETQRLFKIISKLKQQQIAMVYISHNLDEIFQLCDDIVVLRDGQITGMGNRDEFTQQKLVSLMVGQDMNQFFPERSASVSDDVVFQAQNVSQQNIVHDISLQIERGEVVGLFGLMGSGRTELARILFGIDPFESGTLSIHGTPLYPSPQECIRNGMAFLTENRQEEGLLLDAPVNTNIAQAVIPNFASTGLGWIKTALLKEKVHQTIQETNVRCVSPTSQIVKTLSGGNQQKVVFGKWYITNPSFLILDEPTRGIDVGAKHEIYLLVNQLIGQGTSILYISSEIEELIGMCDRILIMKQGEIAGEFERGQFERELILQMALGGTFQ